MANNGDKKQKMSKQKLKELRDALIPKLNDFSDQIKLVKQNLNKLMSGASDGGGLWEGEEAVLYYQAAIEELNKAVSTYKKCWNRTNNVAVTYNKSKKK